tara:strand:- start:87 stop:701 length:615 start_codon:yes stop_codon:yes gene_type:complete
MVRKKQTRKYGKIRKKKNYSLKRKKSSQFRKKRRQRRTKKIIGGFMGWGNPRTRHYWDPKYSQAKKTCWKDKHSLSNTEYNDCKRIVYLEYLKKKLSEEVKKEGKDYINKMNTIINQLNDKYAPKVLREYWETMSMSKESGIKKFENGTFSLDEQGIKNYIEKYIIERQRHHAKKHKRINTDDITINKAEIFSELKQFIQTRQF